MDTESPLYRAKLKMQDATSINQSDPIACYHMGRICLLLGEKDTAQQYLSAAVAMKPALSPARFCLGQALPTATGKHAKTLLLHGLSQYLTKLQEYHETKPMAVVVDDLHSQSFYRSTNTLLVRRTIPVCIHMTHPYHVNSPISDGRLSSASRVGRVWVPQ